MILSLEIFPEKKLDVFSFFPVKNAISIPPEFWFESICASLRMKHSVLILEAFHESLPAWDNSRRWDCCDDSCWLSSRALSVISEAYLKNPMTLQQFKTFLNCSK